VVEWFKVSQWRCLRIANQRLVSLADGQVTFRWTDYAHDHRHRTMTLEAVEFLRRFLQHSLPHGLQRIRQYGLLANRRRTTQLERCRALLGPGDATTTATAAPAPAADGREATPARDECPACGSDRLTIIVVLPAQPAGPPAACSPLHARGKPASTSLPPQRRGAPPCPARSASPAQRLHLARTSPWPAAPAAPARAAIQSP
jgi:hypothetical protein